MIAFWVGSSQIFILNLGSSSYNCLYSSMRRHVDLLRKGLTPKSSGGPFDRRQSTTDTPRGSSA